jgi:hypothetical protein
VFKLTEDKEAMDAKIKLSAMDPDLSTEDTINFMLDNGISYIINDLSFTKPYVEYELSDLEDVWLALADALRFKITIEEEASN